MAHSSDERYYRNKIREETDIPPIDSDERLISQLNRTVKSLWRHLDSNEDRDASVYVGRGGVIYALLEVARLTKDLTGVLLVPDTAGTTPTEQRVECLNRCRTAIDKIAVDALSKSRKRYTFLEGLAGVVTIRVLVYHQLSVPSGGEQIERRHVDTIQQCLKQLCSIGSDLLSEPSDQCELLYGRCGYLYCVMLLRAHSIDVGLDVNDVADTLAVQVVNEGLESSSEHLPLCYTWHEKCYLGAAHGIAGILMTLLTYFDQRPKVLLPCYKRHSRRTKDIISKADERMTDETNETLAWFQGVVGNTMKTLTSRYQLPSGNMMSSVGSAKDCLVQWCHGAPGFIPLALKCAQNQSLAKAAKLNSRSYTALACEFGEVVWERGLLRKGLGLCHGIAGNGLAMLTLFRDTRNPKWYSRSLQFALFAEENYTELRKRPDRPNSLFEGIAGFAVFLAHLLQSSHPFFLGYELPFSE